MATNQPETSSQTPKDPTLIVAEGEAAVAKVRKEKAEAEKAEAEAHRDKLKAELTPLGNESKMTAPSGDVTTDASGFVEVQILGREAARELARQLTGALGAYSAKIETLVIYNKDDLMAVATSISVLEQIKAFSDALSQQVKHIQQELQAAQSLLDTPGAEADFGLTAAISAPVIATGVIKSVAEFVNLFRTATTFQNKDLPVTEDLLVSYLAHNLSASTARAGSPTGLPHPITIYYPSYFPPHMLASTQGSLAVSTVQGLREKRVMAAENIHSIDQMVERLTKTRDVEKADIAKQRTDQTNKVATCNTLAPQAPERTKLQTEIQQLEDDMKQREAGLARYDGALTMLKDLKLRVQSMNTVADQLLTNLDTPDTTTKVAPLSQLIRAERLTSTLMAENTYILRLTLSANGTTMIKKHLFFDASVKHSAGATLTYQLFDKDGRIVDANGMQFYYDWKSADQVRSMVAGAVSGSCVSPALQHTRASEYREREQYGRQ